MCKRVTATAKEPGFCLGRGGEAVKEVPLGIGLGGGVGLHGGEEEHLGLWLMQACTKVWNHGPSAHGGEHVTGWHRGCPGRGGTSAGSWGQLAKGSLARLRSSDMTL